MAELLVDRHEHVTVLTLNRPAQGNRLTTALATEMATFLEAARDDRSIGACVLTGAGDVFCLGGDYQGAGPTRAGQTAYAEALLRSARLMNASEAQTLHLVNEITDRANVLARAVERARQAAAHPTAVVTLGRDLYYAMRGQRADEALDDAERALLAALGTIQD